MNAVHLHLITTHVPVLGTLFGLALLLLAAWRRSQELKHASLWVLVVAAVTTVPVYFSGEPAAEHLKGLAGVANETIEQHEEVAQLGFAGVGLLGVVALVGSIVFRGARKVARWFVVTVLVLGMVAGSLLIWTANLGGKIRHAEIRDAGSASSP